MEIDSALLSGCAWWKIGEQWGENDSFKLVFKFSFTDIGALGAILEVSDCC